MFSTILLWAQGHIPHRPALEHRSPGASYQQGQHLRDTMCITEFPSTDAESRGGLPNKLMRMQQYNEVNESTLLRVKRCNQGKTLILYAYRLIK